MTTSAMTSAQPFVVLIPALNEQDTVGPIVEVARQLSAVRRVLVIDNGSQDGTAANAKAAGADVMAFPITGKAQAVQAGLAAIAKAADADEIFGVLLLDADLRGVQRHHLEALLTPLLKHDQDMTCGVLCKSRLRRWLLCLPVDSLTGQRAIRFDVLTSIDLRRCSGYELEATLNCQVSRRSTVRIPLTGVTHVRRERKAHRDWSMSSLPRNIAGPLTRLGVMVTYARLFISSVLRSQPTPRAPRMAP